MSFVVNELLKAFRTAGTHTDAETRDRAGDKARAWAQHLVGTLTGAIATGSRTPVRDLPAWVTLDVLHGGFTSGSAAAGGPLADDERDLARTFGLPANRTALNAWHLTDAGRARLGAMLDDGLYQITHPENAALLVVTWLVRTGDRRAAENLLAAIAPFADRLRFYPYATTRDEAAPDHVYRRSEAQARAVLEARTPQPRIEAQREALTVWAPFADELLALWWPGVPDTMPDAGAPACAVPDRATLAAAAERYRQLALRHTRCTTHTSKKTNLGVLVDVTLRAAVAAPSDGDLRRVAHAARSMVRKRGVPGSADLATRRTEQRATVAAPSHAAVAHTVAARLDAAATRRGIAVPAAVVGPVREDEATADVTAGTAVPESVARVVRLAAQATVEDLHASGIVPSAEVLAELVPQLAAAQLAATYPDAALARLMVRTYRAFRDRRSLLLTDLSGQVRPGELPWVSAVETRRTADSRTAEAARTALHRVGGLYLAWFPGTPLPNPLLVELEALADHAGAAVPFVPELAADIFQGAFSRRFAQAPALVREHAGPAYVSYYGLGDDLARLAVARYERDMFAETCRRRAQDAGSRAVGWSVTRNGMIIEQSQLLTGHNLATLAALGVPVDLEAAARGAFAEVVGLARKALRADLGGDWQARSLARAAGLAWRHVVWFVALLPAHDGVAITETLADEAGATGGLPSALASALTDLGAACSGHVPTGRPLLGWANGPHPLLAGSTPPNRRSQG